MAKQKRRPANDRAFKKYQAENKFAKNKVEKVKKHISKYPNDEQAKEALVRLTSEKIEYKRKASRSENTRGKVWRPFSNSNTFNLIPEKDFSDQFKVIAETMGFAVHRRENKPNKQPNISYKK